jgi:threonine dehydratase
MKNLSSQQPITIREVWEARKRIASVVKRTPLVFSPFLSEKCNANIYLKLENLHETGAFKIRGAANKILSLTPEEQKRGVTTYSTGNHGMAVAFVAGKLGVKAIVCISKRVPKAKVDAIARLGAELEIYGDGQDEAGIRCYQLQNEDGLTVIEPFDDREIIAGQGTIGLEILEDLPQVGTVIAGLSGGGLISGIGLSLKSNDPNIQVIGVSMEKSAVMHESLKVGKPIELGESDTLADSLLGGIGLDNKYTFTMVQNFMDRSVLVPEPHIAEGMAYMAKQHRMIVEGAAGTGIGALLHQSIVTPGSHAVVVISGCNVDIHSHYEATRPYI